MNYDALNAQLQQLPGYLQAVRSADRSTRGEVARRFAAAHGIDTPSGAVDEQGRFSDPNASHWYDPGTLGPLVVGGSALGVGLLAGGAGAAGAAGGASGGALPASSVPLAYAPGATATNAGALGASVAGAAPLGSFAAKAGQTAGNALTSTLKDKLLSPQGMVGLGASIAGLIGANKGGGNPSGGVAPVSAAMDPESAALLAEARARSQRVDPLHQAVTQLAFSRLPDSARNGISLTGK